METERGVSSLAIDLTQLHRRTVTSFYSNLVTRPTGRAVRMGVESQLAEMEDARDRFLSVLDFSQVRVLDYSCADEIVAKLLLRYFGEDRPADAFFVVRGVQEHHRDAIEAVLERHDLLLVMLSESGEPNLLGPTNPVERACWAALARLGPATVASVVEATGVVADAVESALQRLVAKRVVVPVTGARFCGLSSLPLS